MQTLYTRIRYRRTKYGVPAKKTNRKRRLWLSGMIAIAFLLLLWGRAAESEARFVPEYAKEDIAGYLEKQELSEADYYTLFLQTGLARTAVDALLDSGRGEELLLVQEKLFAKVPIRCEANTPISREERVMTGSVEADSNKISARRVIDEEEKYCAFIPYVEDGDILISFNSHVLGWRNGHAALVVNAERRQVLEARVLGTDSAIVSMEHWQRYPSFVILRLRNADKSLREQIADTAETEMQGKPYRLTAGWGEWMYPEAMTEGTQCAHLVWYAYQRYGYELDSDGGIFVTPRDIYESSLLEVVQVYGMPIAP